MDLFEAGEIVKPRGLHGCLKVRSYLEAGNRHSRPDFVYIELTPGQTKRFRLKKLEVSGKAFFIDLDEINDVESAKPLIGRKVYFPRDILGKLPEGEYYCHDIIGLEVYDEAGTYLGKIEAIFPTGSNDVYVCRKDENEILLPAISQVIRQINLSQRVMTVQIPDGL